MTGVFNVKKSAIWHAIAPTYSATTVIIMDMLPWTAQIRYCLLPHQHATGLTPVTGVKDPPLDIIATPDIHTMITRIDPDSVASNLALVTTDIGVVATRTPIEVAPGHSTDLPAIVVISGTVHWFDLKTSFHPLLWTSSGLTLPLGLQ